MFDYATLTMILEKNINPNAIYTLYVCDNKLTKKRFLRHNPNLQNAKVVIIDDIWSASKSIPTDYKDYRLIH